jgi:gamma-glutamyltranspeptidase
LFREIFVKNSSTNELYKEGDLMKRIKLGRTLRQISEEGVETFYNGNLAEKIISEIQKKGFFNKKYLYLF